MRPQPCQTPIVPGSAAAGELLLQRLQPQRWPVPTAALPAGTALVGGAVRDGLLGHLQQRPDLDLVVPTGAVALCHTLAKRHGGSAVLLDAGRDIARWVVDGWTIDLAAWEGDSLEADLLRRDYSVNAIALPLQGQPRLVDPSGGTVALIQRQLKAISQANLQNDPLRLLRGLRLACELDFALEAQTQKWITALKPSLATVACERVLAELEKLACSSDGAAGLLAVQQMGLLEPWLAAEIPLQTPLARLTPGHAAAMGLQPDEWQWALPLARLACLADAEALQRLRSSRALQERVRRLRQGWQLLQERPLQTLDEADQFTLLTSLEADLPALLLPLPEACDTRTLLRRWRDAQDPLYHPRPPLDGTRLQQLLQRPPGPWLGHLLRHLSRERAFGRLAPDAGEAAVLKVAQTWLQTPAGTAPPPATHRRRD